MPDQQQLLDTGPLTCRNGSRGGRLTTHELDITLEAYALRADVDFTETA
jgi:hypothetical protein